MAIMIIEKFYFDLHVDWDTNDCDTKKTCLNLKLDLQEKDF